MTAGEFVVVLTTLGNPAQARQLVQRLVDERVIACGTILPGATSVYRWRGTVTAEAEVVVLLKTPRACWDALKAAVEAHHPYEVPELLALPVVAGLDRYLDWVNSETS
ncbi:MAG TPA: divalent-cation tolerance protein CutA [Gemmatimonadales bacterium]|nr:divalent-cation tolerance protein CutA [Gemmatimonadales bacterium]